MEAQNEVDSQMNNIITFNGQGCSGKSTQSNRIAKLNPQKYKYFLSYKLREDFENKVYKELGRKETCITYPKGHCQKLYEVEVLGIPSLAWLTAYFHWKVKPFMCGGTTVVLDHYLGDTYADVLQNFCASKFQRFVKDHLGIPHFKQGIHFYLDIDYKTYKDRWCKREGTDPPVTEQIFEDRHGRYIELCDKGYLKCIDAGDGDVNKVAEKIKSVLNKRL